MSATHYAPCPCGSGKKLKFCKCVENPSDYEKLMKLIEGGQGVAAVDRINQLLSQTPNAAWLLAIKGELTLSMQEFETFTQTAERFIELKPGNPLALVMKSVASSLQNAPVENAARYLLEGMSESREAMPAMTLSAITLLLNSLANNGKLSMCGYWSDILAALSNEDTRESDSPRVDPDINMVAKAPGRLLEDAPDAPWKERLAEVLSLARTFRYAQAETKLRNILRDYPGSPGPLSHLLRAQCAQLDQRGAFQTALKLAENLEVTADERAYFRAVALELEPEHSSLKTKTVVEYCEIDSEERIDQELRALGFMEMLEGERVDPVRQHYAALVGDEIPAKRMYTAFSKPLRDEAKSGDDQSREVFSAFGTVVLFSKQTDRPSRALLVANDITQYQPLLAKLKDALQLGNPIEDVSVPLVGHYVEYLRRSKGIVNDPSSALSIDEVGQELVEDFLNMPVAVLDNKTPLEAADDERLRGELLGLLYHFEGEQSIVVEAAVIDEIYSRLQLERPSTGMEGEDDSLRVATVLDLERVEVGPLSDQQLTGLMSRAMGLGATRVFYRCAKEVRSRESMDSEPNIQVAALSGLLSVEPDLEEQIGICKLLEEKLAALQAPVGRVIVQQVSLLHALGRPDEAQKCMMDAVQKYPNDPVLMSFIHYAMQSQGQGGMGSRGMPAGSGGGDDLAMKMLQNASQPKPAASTSDSGLVLPGQQSGDSEGGSKLWLPGS